MSALKKVILVVDDSETARAHTVRALSTEYTCIEAADGNAAYELARKHEIVAIVTDLEMPGAGGLDLMRLLQNTKTTKDIPVVVVTTVTSVDVINSCRALGCAGIALKPVEPFYLLAKLRKLTGQGPRGV
jgi:CheY-like chemotaxis protein